MRQTHGEREGLVMCTIMLQRPPPILGTPQQLSPVQERLASESKQPGASSDSWARMWWSLEGGGGELTAICCSTYCDSDFFEPVCLCMFRREDRDSLGQTAVKSMFTVSGREV